MKKQIYILYIFLMYSCAIESSQGQETQRSVTITNSSHRGLQLYVTHYWSGYFGLSSQKREDIIHCSPGQSQKVEVGSDANSIDIDDNRKWSISYRFPLRNKEAEVFIADKNDSLGARVGQGKDGYSKPMYKITFDQCLCADWCSR